MAKLPEDIAGIADVAGLPDSVTLCMRVEDLEGQPVEGSTKFVCGTCLEPCWISRATRATSLQMFGRIRVMCTRCAGVEV